MNCVLKSLLPNYLIVFLFILFGSIYNLQAQTQVVRGQITDADAAFSLPGETVLITSEDENGEPLNEMATLSARSFRVEETGRYAAAFNDPARMALNFAGVAAGGDDLTNEIIVRGNSSRGSL
ncbi:MAG: hypothetical protein ACI959_000855 [Limisphaerales bacterium]|jgi:hypothetical protein